MENIAQKYQSRARKRHTAAIVVTSLGLAVLANVFAFSQVGQHLKASLLEAGATSASASGDLFLAKSVAADMLDLKAGRDMAQVKELSFSLAVDPSLVDLRNVLPAQGLAADVFMITDRAPFVATVRFKAPTDLRAGQTVATVALTKKRPVATPVNLSSTFFKSDKTYELTNAGIESF
jgi:hypothetical protein